MFKKLFNRMTTTAMSTPATPATPTSITPTTLPIVNTSGGTYTYTIPTPTNMNQQGSIYSIGQGVTLSSSWVGSTFGSGGTFTVSLPSYIINFSNPVTNQEIVRLNNDGTVTWANGIEIDAAAEAISKSLSLGAENKAGITKKVKLAMRDSVFEDLINIAKEKGSLTAEDLTYLLEASKIVEKLKGGN